MTRMYATTNQVMSDCDDCQRGNLVSRSRDTHDRKRETFFVKVGIVHEPGSESENDDGDQDLEATDHGDPDGSLEHMVARPVLLYRSVHRCEYCVGNKLGDPV